MSGSMEKVPESKDDDCRICGRPTELLSSSQPGYREGARYDIRRCSHCQLHVASPLRSDPAIYDAIYRQRDSVPGYSRYAMFAKAVLEVSDPLRYLADSEDCYWAVAQTLLPRRGMPAKPTVLELGSGLGYLTYALRKAGYLATGLDLSDVAVRTATGVYGPYYRCGDAERLAQDASERFDFVVMTEVIEHVEDPRRLVRAALGLLKPSGRLLLTTPNKTLVHPDTLWETDPPPVHLWWFSETSLRVLAQLEKATLEFVDFSAYRSNAALPGSMSAPALPLQPTRRPLLDAEGNVCAVPPPPRGLRALLPAPVKDVLRSVQRRLAPRYSRRASLCAALRRIDV